MKHALRTLWQLQALALCVYGILSVSATAQVNSGSNGSDGAFNPTQNVTIDMADHPTGIYQYTSVNIPSFVTVTFTPNANNTPVVWLVQGDCLISGTVELSANTDPSNQRVVVQSSGPGGFAGGNGRSAATIGLGPGGGGIGSSDSTTIGGNGSFATAGQVYTNQVGGIVGQQALSGAVYGNAYLLPLIGGSGGGGNGSASGGGGGGAILIAVSGTLTISNLIQANGSANYANIIGASYSNGGGGAGSGGSIRLIASHIRGSGTLNTNGGAIIGAYYSLYTVDTAGAGRIRIDSTDSTFNGSISGVFTQGFQPIIIPASGQGVQLAIQSIGGVSVATSPNGVLANPDVILPAQQTNPMNVVVNCSNLPMNTTITLTVHPANGADIVATATNSAGTQASSTATIPVTMPRGGGIIYAKCVSGVTGSASVQGDNYAKNIAETGWTAFGERFAQVEITAGIGRSQQVAYITESGKRYMLPVR